jgi:hypothetical protein
VERGKAEPQMNTVNTDIHEGRRSKRGRAAADGLRACRGEYDPRIVVPEAGGAGD